MRPAWNPDLKRLDFKHQQKDVSYMLNNQALYIICPTKTVQGAERQKHQILNGICQQSVPAITAECKKSPALEQDTRLEEGRKPAKTIQ